MVVPPESSESPPLALNTQLIVMLSWCGEKKLTGLTSSHCRASKTGKVSGRRERGWEGDAGYTVEHARWEKWETLSRSLHVLLPLPLLFRLLTFSRADIEGKFGAETSLFWVFCLHVGFFFLLFTPRSRAVLVWESVEN